MTHPPEPPKLRTYEVHFGKIILTLKGHYNDDEGHYDTSTAEISPDSLAASVSKLLAAVQPDYDALIHDCLRDGTATPSPATNHEHNYTHG